MICVISIVSYVYILCFVDRVHLPTLTSFVSASTSVKVVYRNSGGSFFAKA